MNWILDIFLFLIFLLIVIIAADKGFVKSIWRIVTIVGAFALAYIFGPIIGTWICDNFVLDHVTDYAFDVVEQLVDENSENYDVSTLFDTLPEEFTDLLSHCGADIDDIESRFSLSVTVSEDELYSMARSIALPISHTLSNAVGIISVFLASILLLSLAGVLLKVVVKMPLIRSLDSLLGFIFGIAEGFVIVWILCVIIGLFVERGFMSSSSNAVLYNLTGNSYIFRFFCELSPIDFININVK